MYQLGHYGVALLLYAPVAVWLGFAGEEFVALLGAVICLSFSTLPDCDHGLPFVAHRGITHTIGFVLLVPAVVAGVAYAALEVTMGSPDPTVVGFVYGVTALSLGSHLLADALTPMGVTPFWPLSSYHVSLRVTTAKNPIANYALFALGIAASVASIVVVTGGW
ncbi:metal-dependent hydrolase [Natronosalvus caseinilyticus]|uniref:metal-dependent hydrolase n=1 Tax=Natronosalvus caseinilyticus TaxID=2953747 RepID=UPI0028A8B754|nr:metal-dependent hydrolase [Natronosalvus caseinilyticus]